MNWVAVVPAVSWPSALAAVVVAAVVLWAPGMLVARMTGARGLSLLAVAPVITCGLVGALVTFQSVVLRPLGVAFAPWLAPWLALAGLVALAVVVGGVVHTLAGWRAVPDRTPASRLPSERRLDALPATVACLVGAISFMRATGAAGVVEQSNDSPFHLLAVQRVGSTGDASWQQVRATTGAGGSFYPPLFHDVAALVGGLLRPVGVDVVSACSIVLLLAVAVVWPLGIDALVRTVLTAGSHEVPRWRPDRVGRAAAMTLVVATAAFPAQLVEFGALWPNLLGLAFVPAVLAALVDLAFPAARHGVRASLWTPALDLAVLATGVLALGLAHPDAFLSFVVAACSVIARGAGGFAVRSWRRGQRGLAAGTVAGLALAGAAVLAAIAWEATYVIAFEARKEWDLPEALVRVATLAVVRDTHGALVGPLAVVGAVVCVVRRRHRWLVVGWALTALQVVLAGAVPGRLSAALTGLWYGETARLSAALAVTAVPLAALAVVAVVAGLARVPDVLVRRGVAVLATVAALAWVVVGVGDVHRTERDTYQGLDPSRTLVTPDEVALYARTLRPDGERGATVDAPPGQPTGTDPAPGVVGDPFGGAMFASLYSGRPTPVTHFGQTLVGPPGTVADTTFLVTRRFRQLASDRSVCDAVRRLRIGYAVEDTARVWSDDGHYRHFAGLRHLDGVPGLRLVARQGTVSVYRVETCRATTSR